MLAAKRLNRLLNVFVEWQQMDKYNPHNVIPTAAA